jgi:CPA1 family monovalent cation:H+ antiporter
MTWTSMPRERPRRPITGGVPVSTFELAAALVVLAAVFSYVNYTLLRLPPAIGLMALTLAASLLLVLAGQAFPGLERRAAAAVASVDLGEAFLHGMLGFMLFAGALHVNLDALARRKWTVTLLATAGVLASTAVVGLLTWGLSGLLGVPIRPIYCLLFGALISPTDPIAVLGILRRAGLPKDLEVQIAGESLFNDGVGVVVYFGLLQVAVGEGGLDPGHLGGLFLREAVGGAALGLAAGWVVYRMLRSVDNYQVEVLLSLALAAGGYALADRLHLSGPIAMVVAGLLIGNVGRAFAMSDTTAEHLDVFWELVDEVLNAVLFVLIGLEVLVVPFTGTFLLAGLLVVPVVLLARVVSVGLPVALFRRRGRFARRTVRVLTWGGLRGGISVALALSLPREVNGQPVPEREVVVVLTYVVVVFSILVQGLTIGPLARRWFSPENRPASANGDRVATARS